MSAYLALIVLVAGCGGEEGKVEIPVPRQAVHYFQKAEQAYRAGAYQPALMLTDSTIKYAPDFSGIYVLRGQIYTALDRYEDAAAALSRAAELEPGNAAIHFNWANNAYRREQYHEALRRYEKVLETIREGGKVNIYEGDDDGREARHAILLQTGRTYNALGIADSARLQYDKAIKLAPQKPESYRAIGQLLKKKGEFGEALEYARQALERDSDNIQYKYELGLLLVLSGQFEEAVPYLEEVAEERPWHHGARYNLGQALTHLGQQKKAEEYLAESDSLQQARERLERLGEQAEANTDNPRIWVDYGNALRKAGRIDDAKKAYRHVLSLLPGNIALQNNMAILAMKSGDTTEAISRYRFILQQDPTLIDIWLNLGTTYARSGRMEEAQQAWKNVLKYDPGHATAKKYLAQYFGNGDR